MSSCSRMECFRPCVSVPSDLMCSSSCFAFSLSTWFLLGDFQSLWVALWTVCAWCHSRPCSAVSLPSLYSTSCRIVSLCHLLDLNVDVFGYLLCAPLALCMCMCALTPCMRVRALALCMCVRACPLYVCALDSTTLRITNITTTH